MGQNWTPIWLIGRSLLHAASHYQKKKGLAIISQPFDIRGGADGDRTHDLMNAIHALSQLSYSPDFS
jgi:hypothetical protein